MAHKLDETHDLNTDFWANAYKTHFQPLNYLARRQLTKGNPTEAEDAVSEGFLRAMSYVKNPEAIVNLFAYLWITIKRVWIAKLRRENSLNMESLDDLLATGHHPTVDPQALRILENREYGESLRVRRGPLTPRELLLLELHLEGYTCEEIALVVGEDARLIRTDLNAVRNKVHYRLMR